MNGPIMTGLGLAVLIWAGVTAFEGLWLWAVLLAAAGAAMIAWGFKQKGRR